MRYLFFVNPAAGKGTAQQPLCDAINAYFSEHPADYSIHVTECPGDCEKTARKEAEKGDPVRMFACGGEGTSFELLNGVIGFSNVEIGVFPCGSANDFLKYFGEKAPFLSVDGQVNGTSVPMDLIRAGDRYCLNGCSVGMDAMVANDMSIFKRWPLVSGKLAYKLAIVKTFLRPLGVSLKLTVDGNTLGTVRCLFAVIANAPFYGGGYHAAPHAVPDDGALDFTLVRVIPKLRVPKFLSAYEKGTFEDRDDCTLQRCEKLSFLSETTVPVNLDGEIVETKQMDFCIDRSAVRFVLPVGVYGKK